MNLLQIKKILVDGRKTRLLCGGTGRPLLFLHGWPTSPLAYKQSLVLLAKNFTVYAPFLFDMRCRSVYEIANKVKSMLNEIGLSRVVVVGSSFGGAVAAILARDKRLVSRLVLMNCAGVPRQASLAQLFIGSLKSSAFTLLHGRGNHIIHSFTAMISFFASLRHSETRKLFAEIKASTHTHGCYLFMNIRAKTIIIWCANDKVFPVSNANILQKLIRNSSLIIMKGDHYWSFSKPEQFAQAIIKAAK